MKKVNVRDNRTPNYFREKKVCSRQGPIDARFDANVSKEVLLKGPKIQAKIPSHSGDCVLGEGQLYVLL